MDNFSKIDILMLFISMTYYQHGTALKRQKLWRTAGDPVRF
jgi:hypothetical protein